MKVSSSHDGLLYLLVVIIYLLPASRTAPVLEDGSQAMQTLDGGSGCYYNFEHYYEGDRILTNEPCLNCTCHNRMLMCYLRVCPFTKGIGQDCTVEKKPDQCCPVITCPQVPVALLTSSTTQQPPSTTALGRPDNYGCILNQNTFYPDGAQVPSDPKKPCELCYCIRNHTACVMQECTLNVEGCKPVFQEGICCPVRYDCDYEDALTTQRPTTVGLVTTAGGPTDCLHDGSVYHDGEMVTIDNKQPCEHCYCMRGDIVCAVQECGTPLEGSDCTPLEPPPEQCCPTTYRCANGTIPIKGHETEEGNQVKETPDHPHDEASVEEQSGEDKDKHDKNDESSQSEESNEDNSSHEHLQPETSSISSIDKHPDHEEVEHQTATEQVDELQSGVTAGSSVVTSPPKHETVEEDNESTPASESPSQEKNEEDNLESSTSVHSLLEQDQVQSKPEVHLEEESVSEVPHEQAVEEEADSSQTQEDNVKQTSENSKPEEEFITEKPTEKPITILSEDQENASHHPSMEDSESQSSVVQSVAGEVPEDVATVEGQNNNHLATNEIPEIISTPVQPVSNEQPLIESARVPGEGSCLVDGKTYPPDSDVPPSPDSCHKSCRCVNSIVQCERVECSLPPSNYANCMPVQTPDSCCPTYMCDQAPSDAPEIQNQLSIDKIDTNINEEGTMVEEQHGEHQTSASANEDESATTSGQIDEVPTVPPVVISGIPPENLVPGPDDEIALQPGPSEENLIANNEDSTSSASSDSSVSQHVNEVNNVDHNQEIPISPVKTDESAIHEGPEEITEHDHGKPVENNLVDSQNQHHQIVAGSEGGSEEQGHSEDPALHNNYPTLIYDDLDTTEKNEGLSEVGSDVHTEAPSQHTDSEQEQQNKDSEVNGSVNGEMTENEEVVEQNIFHDELGEAHKDKDEVDQESTTYPHIGDHPVQGQSQEVTSQGQVQPEPFTDHSVPSNWEGYTTEDPNQPMKHSESPTVGTTEVHVDLGEFEQKEPVKESTTSDHIPEGTPSPQYETNIHEFESPGIIPNPVEASGPERGSSEEDEFTTMKTYETEQTLNQNGEIETVITHAEPTESDLHLNEDEHHQETSDISHTVSTDEHSSSSMNEGNTEVVSSEHEQILTATEQSHMPDSIHEQVQQEHEHVSAEDSSPVDSTVAEQSHVEHSHDTDGNVEDQHLIPTESSEISYTDSIEEQHSEKYPEYISHEHSSPSEHAAEEEASTETAHESEHSIVHEGNTELVGIEHEGILTATEQTHTPDNIHEVYGGNTILPADLSSQAPSTASPVTDDGHYLEENSENGDEKIATDKPTVVEDIPSPVGNHEELPTKEEEVTEAIPEVTAGHSPDSTELGVINGSHVTDTYEEAHDPNIDEEDKKQHVPDNIHEDSKLESETSTTEHQQPEHEHPEHQLSEHEQPEHQQPEHEQPEHQVPGHEHPEHQLSEHEQPEHELSEHEQPEHQQPEHEHPEHQLSEHEQPEHQQPEHEQPEHQQPEHEHPEHQVPGHEHPEHQVPEHEHEHPEHQVPGHEHPEHQLPEHEHPEHELSEHEQPEHQQPEHEQPEHQQPQHEHPEHQVPEHEHPEHQVPEYEHPEFQVPEHEHPEHQLSEHEQPEHQLPEHEHPEHQVPGHEHPEHQEPEHEHPEHQVPEHEHPEHQVPEHEHPEHQLSEHGQPEHQLPEQEQQTEEVTHIELHEDVPVSSITSEDHRITEEESDEHSDHHHHHMDNVNPVVDDTVHENYDYTTDNIVKPTSQEDSSPSESVNIDHSGNENSEVQESHDDQENDLLEGSADVINNNNGLLESTVTPAIISEQEHLFPEVNIVTEKPVQEADVEHTKETEQEEITTENFHVYDLSTPSHQVLPITPGPPGIDVSDIIHKEESSTDKEYEPEGSTEHGDSNVATNLESHSGEPSLEETTSVNVPEEVEKEQKKDVVHPEVSSDTQLESEVPDKEHTEHVTDGITNNETSDDAEESSTHIYLGEDHVGESISSELPTAEGESVSESVPSVVESEEQHVNEGVSQSEDHLEGEHHSTDQTQVHQDELYETDITHNAHVPTETIDVTTNAGVSVEDTATWAENVHEADVSKVPEKEEDEGQTEENLTSHRDDTESEQEPAVQEGIDESVTEIEKIHEESTQSVDTHDEQSPTSVIDKDEISSAAVGEQVAQGGEGTSSLDVETETESHGEKLEEPVKEEHTEKVDVAEHTVSSSDSDNENLFVNYLESSSSKTPASDNQVLETTEQHFDENTVEPVTDHYSATEISSSGESHTDDSSLTSDAKPEHPEIHSQVPAVDENLTEPASEVSLNAAHQEGEVHSDTHTEPSTDSALEGSGLEETSSFSVVPIESQSIPESSFETATSLETMFGSSSPETSTSGDSDFHQQPISQTSSVSHEDHVTDATDKPEYVKQDHVPEDSTTLTSETSIAGVHAETESSHLKPQDPVKEPTESSSEIVLEGHVSETVTHTAETAAPPSSTEKVTQGQMIHEEHMTTTSPHQTSYTPIEQTSPVHGIHHHESVAGIHPSAPLFPGWTQKPFEHHTTSEPPPHLPEDSHYPSGFEQDYEDDDGASYGPGTCRYGGKVYLSAQQIPRDDPCDFCFCFRSDIICLQQSCPPPIKGCYQETIKGFCCPRYECHVSMATMLNITTTTTTTTTTLPPHFFAHAYKGAAMKAGCQVKGVAYNVGDRIPTTSGPCLQCRCGANGQMKCEPTVCGPQEALLRQVMDAAAISKRR